MRVKLDQSSLDFLNQYKIAPYYRRAQFATCLNRVMSFAQDCTVEPYCGYFGDLSLCPTGFGSYTNSGHNHGMSVGRYCSIAWNLVIPEPRHPREFTTMSNFTYDPESCLVDWYRHDENLHDMAFHEVTQKPMPVIGHDVWIGANVTLLPGITIGNGAIVAAGSLVVKNIGDYEIWGGNPARFIRKRFDDSLVERLQATAWWRYRLADFYRLPLHDPEAFCTAFLERKADLAPYTPTRIALRDMPGERLAD